MYLVKTKHLKNRKPVVEGRFTKRGLADDFAKTLRQQFEADGSPVSVHVDFEFDGVD